MVSAIKRCQVRLCESFRSCTEGACQMKAERSIFLIIIVLLIGCLIFVYRWNSTILEAFLQGNQGNGQDAHAQQEVSQEKGHQSEQNDDLLSQTEYWRPRQLPKDLEDAEQDNPRLIREIRDYWIVPPSRWETDLRQPNRNDYSQKTQSKFVSQVIRKGDGFFIECGAADGETYSNTLYFEKKKNWTGLLIEPNPAYFADLLQKNRKSYLLNACLSPEPRARLLNFTEAQLAGGLTEYMEEAHRTFIQEHHKIYHSSVAQCFPLYSVLLAIGTTHVDFLSLDVEGPELDILRTIPFPEVTIEVAMVEYSDNMDKLRDIRQFFKATGLYKEVGLVGGLDVVFKRKKNS